VGIDRGAAALLMKLHDDGVSFGRVLTLGRQSLFLQPHEYERVLQRLNLPIEPIPPYAERLFTLLGASAVDAMDVSTFEGASVVHDLNQPVPDAWHTQYDLIVDGGTLEHVFNVPVAFGNVMRMLKVGGRFVSVTPTEGWCGHGFYQFSPELFWRTFTRTNGFSVVEMYATTGRGDYYAVSEPAAVKARVELCAGIPVMLMVHARRDVQVDPFTEPPQQSDYVAVWSRAAARGPAQRAAWKMWPLVRTVLQQRRHWRYLRARSFRNRRFFTPANLPL
jgi:SAM-dependent methyltransferase